MRILVCFFILFALTALKRPGSLRHKWNEWPHIGRLKDRAWSLRIIPVTEREWRSDILTGEDPSATSLWVAKRLQARSYYLYKNDFRVNMSDIEMSWFHSKPDSVRGWKRSKDKNITSVRFSFWSYFSAYKQALRDEIEVSVDNTP